MQKKGHFLGLYHTFGSSTCDPKSDGDGVNDTPQHLNKATINCHVAESLRDTCPNIPGLDPVDNFMSKQSHGCRTTILVL
jgi:hypothetical protein